MGLDMYLSAKRYSSGHRFVEDRSEFERLVAMFDMEDMVDEGSPHAWVEFCIGYWRKANQIHNWFVEHCQDGVDDCREVELDRESLKELRQECAFALEAKKKAGKKAAAEIALDHLPPREGFFFGNYEVDEWYWKDLEYTVEVIDKALALDKYWYLTYQSSW